MTKRWRVLFLSVLVMFTLIAIPVTSYADETDGTQSVPVLTAETGDGWADNGDGTWSYIQNGYEVKNAVLLIGGKYYAFNYNGIMYANETFGMYSETHDRYAYYRAKEDGSLYVNTWYEDEFNDWYYYGSDGATPYGYTKIGGVYYIFEYDGEMAVDTIYTDYTDNGQELYYVVNEDGHAYPIDTNKGWQEIDGNWYYCQNGEICRNKVVKLGGKYYGFAWSGKMYTEGTFDAVDEQGEWKSYRVASSSGELFNRGWYSELSEWDDDVTLWYYYGTDAAGYQGFQTIGGTSYYFWGDGQMAYNTHVETEETIYLIGADGTAAIMNPNDWTRVGNDWFYAQNGELYTNRIAEIKGHTYAFDYSGRMRADELFYIYDQSTDKGIYYYANSEGYLVKNKWAQDEYGDWYYLGADYKAVTGIQVIQGVYYGFSDYGRMYDDTTFRIRDENGNYTEYRAKKGGALYIKCWYQNAYMEWYYYDANGQLVEGVQTIDGVTYGFDGYVLGEECCIWDSTRESYYYVDEDGIVIQKPGFYKADGYWVYVEDASGKLKEGWLKGSGGEWYYLDPVMYNNTAFVDQDGTCYYVNNAGVCQETSPNGFFEDVYVENGALVKNDWRLINGSWYYFYEDGRYGRGTNLIGETWYYFDEAGAMKSHGWVQSSYGTWFYADESGALAMGPKTINGTEYFFDPAMVTDDTAYYNGNTYLLGDDGVVLAVNPEDGWLDIGNDWYYVEEGYFVYGETRRFGDNWYAFDYSGKMITNQKYSGRYYGSDGIAMKGWIKSGDRWMYADENNNYRLYDYGEYTIGNVDYLFVNQETALGVFEWAGYIYTTDANGAIQSKLEKAAGWFVAEGEYFYWPEGDQYYSGWVGNYYVRNGVMRRDGMYRISDESGKSNYYYFDPYGNCQKNGWIKYGRTYLYADANGALYQNKWIASGSTWYYIMEDCRMAYYDTMIDGQPHSFARDGRWLGQIAYGSEGWAYGTDGCWYYYHAGYPVTGSRWIDGKWYCFDDMGVMMCDTFQYNYDYDYSYYYGPDGVRAEYVGWKEINNRWVYFSDNHTIITGWIEVNGVTYFQTMSGVMTGISDIDGKFYQFDESGAFIGILDTPENGWYQFYDEWYYFIDGEFAYDRTKVGDTWYYFENGRMMTDVFHRDWDHYEESDGNYGYYYGADGAQRTAAGWFLNDGEWMYIDQYGRLVDGVQVIGGTTYYFSNFVWVG